jgi:hypothetical protein
MTCFINICEVLPASMLLAPLFWFACIVAYLPYGFLSLSFLTLETVLCRDVILARELCRMSIGLHTTSLVTRSEKRLWPCACDVFFRSRIMCAMCDAVWLWGWMLTGTSQVARKERTRTVMYYCGRTPVSVHVPVIWAPRRCVGFIVRRRRRSPELNELKWSRARTHVYFLDVGCFSLLSPSAQFAQ